MTCYVYVLYAEAVQQDRQKMTVAQATLIGMYST